MANLRTFFYQPITFEKLKGASYEYYNYTIPK